MAVATVALASAPAFARAPRTQVHRYESPWGMRWAHFWDDYVEMLPEMPPLLFTPRAGDRSVEFLLESDAGRLVYAHLLQRTRDGETVERYYCGKRTQFELVSRQPVEVKVYVGACENHLISYDTSGSITATFSSRIPAAPSGARPHDH